MGEQHGYGIARRIEQTSEGKLSINYARSIRHCSSWSRKADHSAWACPTTPQAKFYTLTKAGRKQIERDTRQWAETSAIMTRFLAASED